MSEQTSPLHGTAERLDAVHEWLAVVLDTSPRDGWLLCSEVDAGVIADWERRAAESQVRYDGRSHPVAAASYALGWYADIASRIGGTCLLLDRRVPRLGRDALAFRCHPEDHYPDGVAFRDPRFWCLPDDPDADHPDATVVADVTALGAILRAEVRAHADDFLSSYRPGARLPRRDLLGSFFDGLDVGFWQEDADADAVEASIALAATVLPGATPEFADRSTLHRVDDDRGGVHLTRLRVSCCNYYRVSDIGEACTTCPRTSAEERRERLCAPAE
ncbi:(2Fe-2S)-binding protein [Nocardioides caeni]|uniref:(2Fe-2S)-binding protein n=1 Tax=Nocardioides caeni TaxID=574700 RepID=UPI0013053C99|nr:(2Fe-2S)-binding protein [Nocardioides caeni]